MLVNKTADRNVLYLLNYLYTLR